MMTSTELEQTLLRLRISQSEAAQLLSVASRTVRRWLEGEEVPGPVEQAIRAWVRLHDRKLAWRPDSTAITEADPDEIARHRAHAINLAEILARVEARGGPRLPWIVDRQHSRATLGMMEVSFHVLANGSFSLGNYTRKDGDLDMRRDQELIEDAAYCIAREFTKGPVTLMFSDRPWRSGVTKQASKEFPSKSAAIQYACANLGSEHFHDPFIMAGVNSDPLMDKHEIRRECERRRKSVSALRALADYVRRHSALPAIDGPHMLTPQQKSQRIRHIEMVGEKISSLASVVEEDGSCYQQFETLLGALHKLGFFPTTSLVSEVARALSTP
jgi:hypothetical protein